MIRKGSRDPVVNQRCRLIEMHLHVRFNHVRIKIKGSFDIFQMLAVPAQSIDPNTFCSHSVRNTLSGFRWILIYIQYSAFPIIKTKSRLSLHS